MSDLTSNPTLPSDPSPRDLARQARIDTLRRAGYDEQRLAALETESSPPEVPNDIRSAVPYFYSEDGWLDPDATPVDPVSVATAIKQVASSSDLFGLRQGG